jgi:hypothetical protein
VANSPGPGSYAQDLDTSMKRRKGVKPPPFGKSVKEDAGKSLVGHAYSPGPGYYHKEALFDSQVIAKD